jgi:4-amino-4-deoxy-L-arabinose transferase-like glycosyltransferase
MAAETTTSTAAHPTTRTQVPPTPRRRRRRAIGRIPLALALLLVVGVFQSLAWDIALPAFQGPDEPAHFAYVQYLAETGQAPSATTGSASYSTEIEDFQTTFNLSSLRGDLTGRPAWSSADLALWHAVEKTMPKGARANGDGPNPQARNPPLYYAIMAIPYRLFVWLSLPKRIFMLRLFSALSYLATIALVWLIAGEVFGRVCWKQTLTAGVVALEPQFAFIGAIINADSLLIALTTGFLLAALRLVKRGPSLKRVLVTTTLAAAAMLTHGRGLVVVPVLCVALIVTWIRYRPAVRNALAQGAASATVIVAALTAYYLFGKASGGSLYGGNVSALGSGAGAKAGFNLRQFLSSIYQFYFPRLRSLRPRLGPEYGYRQMFIETFYGEFGWLEITFTPRIYDALQVFSALGLVGFYTACVVRRRRLVQSWPIVTVMLSLLLTLLLFLHYVSYRALLGNSAEVLITGRYLLPMISLFGLAITFTVGSLPRRLGPLVGAFILAAGVLLSLMSIGITMMRFYA